MELKDFVRDSILQIVAGMVEAQDAVGEYGASVNPPPAANPGPSAVKYVAAGPDGKNVVSLVQELEFDVALTVRGSTKGGGEISVRVGLIGGEVGGNAEKGHEDISRLKFKVPVGFPIGPGVQPRTKPRTYVGDRKSGS